MAFFPNIGGGGTIGGSTGVVDNAVLRADGAGGITLQNSPVIMSDLGASVGQRETITSSGVNIALTTDMSGTLFTNSAVVEFTLPALTSGVWFRFVVGSANFLRVNASGGATMSYLANTTAVNGYARSQTQGDELRIVGLSTGWVVTDLDGTWTYDS